ncbi:type II toxin-antitoxin system PemK/MazF family toxin [Thiolapillus sp.]|nr:type II toxin-antitoxin system PemK/MazF family toxin [Thiolapillus sp.]
MVKRRPAVVISPRLRRRQHLCTVVPLSTTPPNPVAAYHHKFTLDPVLPKPYNSKIQWVKADMLYTVSFDRLYLPFEKKDGSGKRIYDIRVLDKADMIKIQQCILHGIGLTSLTDYL